MGVEDNLSGPVWVMEWTSVIVIMLRIPKRKRKKKKKKNQPNKIKENKEEEPRNKGSKYKVICFIVLIFLQLKPNERFTF